MMRASSSYGRVTTSAEIVHNAWKAGLVVPTFNVPYLPMIEPIIRALVDYDAFAFIGTAPIEWSRYKSRSLKEVHAAFAEFAQREYVRLHLDHVVAAGGEADGPWRDTIASALSGGYHSVMIDASDLTLDENIRLTREAVAMAHEFGIACEAELGPVAHGSFLDGVSYDERVASGSGLTDPEAAARFVSETGCDWLAVSAGNLHGAMATAWSRGERPPVRLDIQRIASLSAATKVPLALHGLHGTGGEAVRQAVQAGVAKVNLTAEIRHPYEQGIRDTGSVPAAQEMLFELVCNLLYDYFGVSGKRPTILGDTA